MKKLYLPAICMLLITSLASGQVVLPVSVMRNCSNLPEKVTMNLNALDEFTMADNPLDLHRETVRSEVVLDSTISYKVLDIGGGDLILSPFVREDYFYMGTNQQLIMESNYNEGIWHPSSRTLLAFDDQGRIMMSLAEVFNDEFEIWEPDSRFMVYPHGDSHTLMDSLFVEGWSVELNAWVRLLEIRNTYDQDDKVLESLSSLILEGIPVVFRDVYFYDIDGHNHLTTTFLVLEGMEIPAGEVEHEYNLGLLSMSTSSVFNELGELIPTERVVYTYVFQTNLISSVQNFEWDEEKQDWRINSETHTGYDQLWRIDSLETVEYPLESEPIRNLSTNHYREDNKLAAVSLFNYDQGNDRYVYDELTKYFYSEGTSGIIPQPQVHELTLFPNPTQSEIRFNLDTQGLIELYDNSGTMLTKMQGRAGLNSIDLSSMPSGIYYVSIPDKEVRYIGKVIKK